MKTVANLLFEQFFIIFPPHGVWPMCPNVSYIFFFKTEILVVLVMCYDNLIVGFFFLEN